MLPLSLYVHLPWCVRKCPYCDFNSWAGGDAGQRAEYLDALLADLANEAQRAGDRELLSVFLGGGTPSLFTPPEIATLIDSIRSRFTVGTEAEITMEANPGTIECGDPAGYLEAGVNRLSIGAQSFSQAALERLGRIHSTDDILRACAEARDAGFDNINIDLMHALPEQTPEEAVEDIRQAVALEPDHISWYQLTLEPNTVFHARPPSGLPNQETAWGIQEAGGRALADAGYAQYEVSAWARSGRECEHNLNYWRFGDYLAVGAGAHGKLTTGEAVCRYRKPSNPRGYVEFVRSGGEEPSEPITVENLVFEYMLNVLRLREGFSEKDFEARTGLSRDLLADKSEDALEKNLIERKKDGVWRPTELGRRFLNDLQGEFLP